MPKCGVVHFHRKICCFGCPDQNQPVRADAEMAVAQESHFIGGRLVRTVFVEIHHEIVAGGVRFVNNAWNAHTSSLYTR